MVFENLMVEMLVKVMGGELFMMVMGYMVIKDFGYIGIVL